MKKHNMALLIGATMLGGLFTLANTDNAQASVDNGNGTVTVEAGDTYLSIANTYGMQVSELEQLNGREIGGFDIIYPSEIVQVNQTNNTTQTNTQTVTTENTSPNVDTYQTTTTYDGSNLKSYVLNRMVSATGVPASTWDYIITRESNWQPTVYNSLGYYGLFQLAPSYEGNGGSVDAQINNAIRLFNAQGMHPWDL